MPNLITTLGPLGALVFKRCLHAEFMEHGLYLNDPCSGSR